MCLPFCLNALTHIVNYSLSNSTFPSAWKSAIVVPLPKSDSPNSLSEFRAISLLPLFSKLLEKVVYKQLIIHIKHNGLIPDRQSGFRCGHSTITTLLDVTDDYLRAIDKKEVTTAVFLDYTKAFDCLNHEMLLAKLKFLGISDGTLRWFWDYLSERNQIMVKLDTNNISQPVALDSGVPQGSILGPILFVLYMSGFENVVHNCKLHCYTDDSQIYLSYKPISVIQAINTINENLNRIEVWSKNH
ncbi:reverse transcriptase, partial [Rhyzopertha dominica]